MSNLSTENYKIVNFELEHIDKLKQFSDREIGRDYFSIEELKEIHKLSHKNGLNASFLLLDEVDEIKGMRLTFAPGNWLEKIDRKTAEDWEVNPEDVAYFKTIFLCKNIKGKGWGNKLSSKSIKVLKQMKAKGIVCHSWKESPNNSSFRYLSRLGFTIVAEHENFWKPYDYECVRCGKPPCLCTATEMILKL